MQFNFGTLLLVLGLTAKAQAFSCFATEAVCENDTSGHDCSCYYDATGVNGVHYCNDC